MLSKLAAGESGFGHKIINLEHSRTGRDLEDDATDH
jgi:hypothetical protein